MAQPVLGDVHLSAALTEISTAYVQSTTNYVADRVFANVPVVHQANKYHIFSKSDFFRDEAQLRADGAESAGTGFNLSTGSYSAAVWALHKDIGPQVRANADPAIDLDVATTKELMQKMLIKRDRQFTSTFVKTGVWGTDVVGGTDFTKWSDDAGSDPITDVLTGQSTILQNTGFKPNVLTIGWQVYQALRKHPLIIDRIKYTTATYTGTITTQLLAQLFDVDEVVVSSAVYNSASEGNADSFSFIHGKNALLVYRNPNPGLMMPSAGYIFPWMGFTGMNNMGIRTNTIPMPWLGVGTDRIEVEMSFDMQVIGTDLGYYLSACVA